LSKKQVNNIVRASESSFVSVIKWIYTKSGDNITVERLGGDAILIKDATIYQIEKLFNVTLRYVGHQSFGHSLIRVTDRGLDSVIPSGLSHIIEVVSPIFNFIRKQRKKITRIKQATQVATVDPSIIPLTILNLYNITNNINNLKSTATSTQAIAEMQHVLGPEGFVESDLKMYQSSFALNKSLTPTTVVGKNDFIDPTGECTLDTDIIGTVAQGSPTTFWLVDEWMYELGLALSTYENASNLPDVVSISWGFSETRQCGPTDYGPDMPANCSYLGIKSNLSYVVRTNTEFMKLASRGMTLVASSGDSGAPGDINADCSNDDKQNGIHALNPEFPASSPYVLSVGATQLLSSKILNSTNRPLPCKPNLFWKAFTCASNGTEQTASLATGSRITTGGGFSAYSPRPEWQNDVVKTYLENNKNVLPPTNTFNASNRAYPDVSAIGHNVLVYLKGTGSHGWDNFDGTSVSAPIWAGIITLLNNARKSVNKTTLGMLAPMLYNLYNTKNGFGFKDIAGGNNKCTNSDDTLTKDISSTCCKYGFTSAKNSWDPVNGMGVPKFAELVHYVKDILP
jgi:subtilase family serine protease